MTRLRSAFHRLAPVPALLAIACSAPQPTDVLVVGAGISGLSAALEAARGGATVRVVEMSSIFGGHAVMAHGGLCIVDTPVQAAAGVRDSPELAERDFLEWGEDADREWVSFYVRNSDAMVHDWLTDLGITFTDHLLQLPGNSVPRFHSPAGRGLGLVEPIYRACVEHPSIEFVWNTAVDGLLRKNGRVIGVEAEALRTGKRRKFRAEHTILATGGFQSNLEMVREFWPEAYPFPERILVGSGVHSVGSGHRLAEASGAALVDMDRQWNYATGLPDPRYPSTDRGLNSSNGAAVWVNLDGERFVNETGSTKERFRALLRQSPARFWMIFDQKGKRRLFVSGSHWADPAVVERVLLSDPEIARVADSLEELAQAAGLPAETLVRTVERYNRMLVDGVDEDFGRFGHGGVPYDLAPGWQEGPIPLDTPPFYALSLYPLARKSMGGVAIDADAQVLDRDGSVIPGLYAVGELAGFGGINGWAGLEGTFLGPSIVTGRVAARTVLAGLGVPTGVAVEKSSPDRPGEAPAEFENRACTGCHRLDLEIAESRPGYWHFEKTHTAVLEGGLACRECHAGLYPYRGDQHRLGPTDLADTCSRCHLARLEAADPVVEQGGPIGRVGRVVQDHAGGEVDRIVGVLTEHLVAPPPSGGHRQVDCPGSPGQKRHARVVAIELGEDRGAGQVGEMVAAVGVGRDDQLARVEPVDPLPLRTVLTAVVRRAHHLTALFHQPLRVEERPVLELGIGGADHPEVAPGETGHDRQVVGVEDVGVLELTDQSVGRAEQLQKRRVRVDLRVLIARLGGEGAVRIPAAVAREEGRVRVLVL